jgi:hypothetical protein
MKRLILLCVLLFCTIIFAAEEEVTQQTWEAAPGVLNGGTDNGGSYIYKLKSTFSSPSSLPYVRDAWADMRVYFVYEYIVTLGYGEFVIHEGEFTTTNKTDYYNGIASNDDGEKIARFSVSFHDASVGYKRETSISVLGQRTFYAYKKEYIQPLVANFSAKTYSAETGVTVQVAMVVSGGSGFNKGTDGTKPVWLERTSKYAWSGACNSVGTYSITAVVTDIVTGQQVQDAATITINEKTDNNNNSGSTSGGGTSVDPGTATDPSTGGTTTGGDDGGTSVDPGTATDPSTGGDDGSTDPGTTTDPSDGDDGSTDPGTTTDPSDGDAIVDPSVTDPSTDDPSTTDPSTGGDDDPSTTDPSTGGDDDPSTTDPSTGGDDGDDPGIIDPSDNDSGDVIVVDDGTTDSGTTTGGDDGGTTSNNDSTDGNSTGDSSTSDSTSNTPSTTDTAITVADNDTILVTDDSVTTSSNSNYSWAVYVGMTGGFIGLQSGVGTPVQKSQEVIKAYKQYQKQLKSSSTGK